MGMEGSMATLTWHFLGDGKETLRYKERNKGKWGVMGLQSNYSEGQGDRIAAKKKLVTPFCVHWYSVLVEKAEASAQMAELGDRTPRYQFPAAAAPNGSNSSDIVLL